jgi:hypothetical protein
MIYLNLTENRVWLNMTNEKALEQVDLEDLKKYALDKKVEPSMTMR